MKTNQGRPAKGVAVRGVGAAQTMSKKHIGSRLDDFLAEEAMLEDVTAVAVKRVISWQIEQEIKTQNLTK